MTITTTAIGFVFSTTGLAFCGIHFFKAFQKIGGSRAGNRIGILLSTLFIGTALQHGILAIGGLLFIENPEAFYKMLIFSHFLLTIATAIGAYLMFYIFFPSVSPWPGTFSTFLFGVAVVVLTIVTHPLPFKDTSGGIDWNMSYKLSVILAYLVFFNIAIPLFIFINSFFNAKSREVKAVSFIIVVLTSLGMINVFMRFLLPNARDDSVRTYIFDRILILMGALFISVFMLPPVIIRWFSKIQK